MQQGIARPASYGGHAVTMDLPAWKSIVAWGCGILLALVFFVSGCWKLTEPFQWSQAMTQFLVPGSLALPFTILLGIGEAFGAALIIVPRFRRWGAILIGLLLVAFMAYIGLHYSSLVGKECTCFPIVKRTIGPGFFVGDAVLLLMSIAAAVWAKPSSGVRAALVILGAVSVFAGVSYGVNASHESGLRAPASITVDGKPYSLENGKVLLFFFDPECLHCDAAARKLAKLNWKDAQVIAIPTRVPQFAADFLHDTGLKAKTSNDLEKLRAIFKFVDPPYGAALENGRQVGTVGLPAFEADPAKTLRPLGFVE